MRVTTDDYELGLLRVSATEVEVSGSRESLECFTAGVALAGASRGPTGASKVEVVREPIEGLEGPENGILRVTEGTVALWLSFESLNYL